MLVFEILLDLGLDANYKQGGFSKILLKKGLQFALSSANGIVAFNLSFVLLLMEVNPVFKKQGREGDAFIARSSSHIKMILTLFIKVIALYIRALIVKVGVLSLEWAIAE